MPTRLPKGRLVGPVQRAQLKVLQNFKNTHLLPPSPLNAQVSQTVFPFSPEHPQSCLASEVIYLRCGHKRRAKSKKTAERKAEESKQTQTPVKCLSSLTELRANEGLSALAAAAVRGGPGMPESSPSRYQASCSPHRPCIACDPARKHYHFDGSPLFTSCVYKHRVCYGGTWSVQGTRKQLAGTWLVIGALQGFMGD